MENKFDKFLKELNLNLVKSTIEEIKKNDALTFAKLGLFNDMSTQCADVNLEKELKKINSFDENEVISFAREYFMCHEINTLDDVLKHITEDLSIPYDFFGTYSFYNGYSNEEVFEENIKNENYDGIFELMPKDEKIDIISNVPGKISTTFRSIYTDEHLTRIWNGLRIEVKKSALEKWLLNKSYFGIEV